MKRLLPMLLAMLLAGALHAQQQFPTLERGLNPQNLYHFGGIDNVNVFNGNLTLVLPIGQSYPIDGGLNYQLTLSYNSNLWDWIRAGGLPNANPAESSNAGLGWILGFGDFVPLTDAKNNSFVDVYASPDGGEHRFEKKDPLNPNVRYTADGSNLRLRKVLTPGFETAWIDFPDGTIQTHQKAHDSYDWQLREIASPRGEKKVRIDYLDSRPSQCASGTDAWWKITDDESRTHYVCFRDEDLDGLDVPMVETVVFDGPQGQTATWRFTYQSFKVQLPKGEPYPITCGQCEPTTRTFHSITVLKSIVLPDGSAYKFGHYPDTTPAQSELYYTPDLLSMTLPTGGKIEYGYNDTGYDVASIAVCTFGYNNSIPSPTFGSPTAIVTSRTIKPAPLSGGIPESYAWKYRWNSKFSTPNAICNGPGGDNPVEHPIPEELIATVTDPAGGRLDAHFSVWPGDMKTDSVSGFKALHYGFPYGAYDQSQDRYLSTERYRCLGTNCTKLRTTFVRHDIELREDPILSLPNVEMPIHRLASQRVFYHDDPAGCQLTGTTNLCRSITTENRLFDGYGHYREIETKHDFGAGGTRVVKTDTMMHGGVARVLHAGEPWFLNEYENRIIEENGQTIREQACFDTNPNNSLQRFLRAKRAVTGTGPGAKDVITVFSLNETDHNLEYERTYGGDKTQLPAGAATEADLCTAIASLGTPAYEVRHTYKHGVLETSQFTGTPFLSLDLTIDKTGLVTQSRDTAGVPTDYFYDRSGRVKEIRPTGAARISYTYANAVLTFGGDLSTPAKVTETSHSSTGSISRIYLYDSLGRVWREKQQMPADEWRLRETLYDGFNRKLSLSEWTALPAGESELTYRPQFTTNFYDYDVFGRVGFLKAPDGAITTFGYTGDRVKTRTSRIATSLGGESDATTTEEYDGFGRLVKVVEPAGATSAADPTGADVTATYGYDAANHLTDVAIKDENAVVQDRAFDYDGRGFLTSETHRENGETTYEYDALGNAWKKTNGGTTLEFTYDPAGRLTDVVSGGAPIKAFRFGPDNSGSGGVNKQKGKLVTAIRHNDLPATGKVDVTETYDYDKPGGLLSKKTTLVERVVDASTRQTIQKFEYEVSSYDDLMLPKTVKMPTCLLHGCEASEGIGSLTYNRSAAYLTSIQNFGSMTYHPSGMVEEVKHDTPQGPVDKYSAVYDMARPNRITFQGCSNTKPYFLPGLVLAKVDPNACGIQVTWPAATLCGGVSNIKYRIKRNGVDLPGAACLTNTKYLDTTAVKGATYTYTIVAEGPAVEGGSGTCQLGQTSELDAVKAFEFKSCDADTTLTLDTILVSVGITNRFQATLTTPNGPLQNEDLTFSVLGQVIGTARTGANGRAILDKIIDVEPQIYPGGVSVTYAGGLYPAKTTTGELRAVCDGLSYSVKPSTLNVLAAGGRFPILVVTSSRCGWQPNPAFGAFFSVDPASQQKGIGTFDVVVPDATGGADRVASLRVNAKSVIVEQSTGCTFRFSPGVAYVPFKTNAQTSIDVSAPPGCAWEVTSEDSWLELDNVKYKGTGDGYILFRVDENEGAQRMAVLSLNGGVETAKVNQNKRPEVECPVLIQDLTGGGSISNGQNVTMRIHVEGTFLEYEWWHNGRVFMTCDDCPSYTVAPGLTGYPSPGQTSTFQVVVSNSNTCDTVYSDTVSWTNTGQSCQVAHLADSTFHSNAWPPDINSPGAGSQVRLRVFADNWPNPGTPTYQWYHGFAGDTDNKVSDAEGGKTDEIEVRPHRTEFYWVQVTNVCGTQQSRTAAVYVTPAPRFRRRAVRKDFTGDGRADLLWQNTVTGQNEVWPMTGANGAVPGTTISLPSSPTLTSRLQSVGDINDDAEPDLIFRDPTTGANTVWMMNNTSRRDIEPLDPRPDGRWSIGGVADLDNDYSDDLIWHNNATGENEIWFQGGTEHEGTWALPANTGSGWGLHGADDFNGDDKPDLFFHDRTTGANAIWYMDDAERNFEVSPNGAGSSAGARIARRLEARVEPLVAMPDTNWMPAMVGDVNGDGKPDVVWRNVVTGENAMWLMNGAHVNQTIPLPTRADTNWQIGGGGSTNAGNPGGGTDPRLATSMTVLADPAPINTATAVTATLTAGATPLAQKEISFSLNGTVVSRLRTDATGTATAAMSVAGLAAGTYVNAVTVRFDGDTAYTASSASANLVVAGAVPEVTWLNPAAIGYGTPLGAAQLNATATVPGTFVYAPPAGTILNAGYATLAVTFTPNDTTLTPITRNAILFVNKAPSSVTWVKPAGIAYGTPLSGLQQNATSSLAGSFSYDPEPGSVLPVGNAQTLSVTFEPESPNYASSAATTTIDVVKGAQVIQWDDPQPINSTMPLGAVQLNARIIPSGTAPAGAITYTPPAGTVLAPGVHELRVAVAATANYDAASAAVDIIVKQTSTPSTAVQWANPASIVYGTPLSATQLNATATMPGTFVYTPPAGTILNGGTRQLFVLFTPTDTRYEPATASVSLEVTRAQQTIVWNKPAAITYPTELTAIQLNAAVQVSGPAPAGSLVYSPAYFTALPAGLAQTLTVTAQGTENYEIATKTVTIDVLKATPAVTWAQPAPIVYKTLLGNAQLNATASVPGTFVYTPPAGTLLEAGMQTLSVTFTPADTNNYNVVTRTVTLEVQRATPVLAWTQPAPVVYRTLLDGTQLNATADVAGTFVYTPPAGTLLQAGMHTLTAQFTPSDTRNYNGATVTTTIEVQRATPILTWPQPAGIVYGVALGASQLNATADVDGAFVYTPASGTILNAGAGQTLRVHFTPSDTRNFNEADAATTIDVAKATQTIVWAAPAPIVYGTPLSTTQLSARVDVVGPSPAGAVTYTPVAGTVLDAGTHTLAIAVAETGNYEPAAASVTLTVNRAPLTLVVDAKVKPYGAALPALTGTLAGVQNNDPITASYATTATQQSPVAVYPIAGSLNDPNGRLVNYDVTITPATLTVTPVPLVISANAATKQYSDPLPALTATFTGFVLGETPAVLGGVLSIQTAATPLSPVGTYTITIGGHTSGNYVIAYVNGILTVTPEDARVLLTSPAVVSAAKSGPTTVYLSATIRDISATADAAGDVHPGDIRTATLAFVDRATNQVLCNAPIGLLSASDERIGVATCTFTRDFGAALPASLTVGARVAGNYARDEAAENATLSIVTQTPDMITGSAGITIATAAGTRAPDTGSSAKLNLNLQYDKNGAVQGKLTFTFTRTEGGIARQYELNATAISSLAIVRTPAGGTATVLAAATLRDVTTNTPVVVFEGAPLIVTATDAGEPSTNDAVSIAVPNAQGGLWLATGWNGLKAVEQTLANGNLAVHYKK